MADTSAEADIRGIDIDRLSKGFADEENVLKKFTNQSKTKAREIRWFQKTSGFLDTTDTSGITKSRVRTSWKARPFVAEQSWTRQTSYVKHFFIESPLISYADIKDSDVDVLATNVRDLVRCVERQVDARIYQRIADCAEATPTTPLTLAGTDVLTTASTDEWDQTATCNPILDILNGQQKIRAEGYDPREAVMGMNSIEHKLLVSHIINTKGSSIPSYSSEKIRTGTVMEILGNGVVVSENFTTDWVIQWIPNRSVSWKQFTPITSVVIDDPGIGKKIRVWEDGECLKTDPKSIHVISNTGVQ